MVKNISLIIDARYVRIDRHDGISRYVTGIAHGLKTAQENTPDFDIRLMVSDTRQLENLPHFPWFLGPSPISAKEVFTGQILNKQEPDVVFSPMQTMGAIRKKFKLILTLHDLIYYEHPTPPAHLPTLVRAGWRLFHMSPTPQRLALNRADAVATVSHTSAQLIRDKKLTSRPVHVIPNAADPDWISTKDSALKNLEIRRKNTPKKLTYMGSFMPYKDVETLVKTAELLPDYELHLVSQISDSQREKLIKLAPHARLVFHNGLSDDAYRKLLKESTALLHASRAEGYGLPLMEAMSVGIPVICSRIPIFEEVTQNAALYAPVGQPQAFAAAVRTLDDPTREQKIIEHGLSVAQKSSWNISAQKLLGVAKNLIKP